MILFSKIFTTNIEHLWRLLVIRLQVLLIIAMITIFRNTKWCVSKLLSYDTKSCSCYSVLLGNFDKIFVKMTNVVKQNVPMKHELAHNHQVCALCVASPWGSISPWNFARKVCHLSCKECHRLFISKMNSKPSLQIMVVVILLCQSTVQ